MTETSEHLLLWVHPRDGIATSAIKDSGGAWILRYWDGAIHDGPCNSGLRENADPAALARWASAQLGRQVSLVKLGTGKPHHVRCAGGHVTTPRPDDIYQGSGVCRTCSGMAWDAFYVVVDLDQCRVKFGITSGNPNSRLRVHRRYGYREVVRLSVELPEGVALEVERAVRAALRLAAAKPVRGREYYDSSTLAVILDVADNYLSPAGLAVPRSPKDGSWDREHLYES
jgi:hypothetical protein